MAPDLLHTRFQIVFLQSEKNWPTTLITKFKYNRKLKNTLVEELKNKKMSLDV